MLFLPIGRDSSEVRRHAWISYAIVAANVLAFLGFNLLVGREAARHAEVKFGEAVEYLANRPHLEVPETLSTYLAPDADLQLLHLRTRSEPPAPSARETQQRELDRRAAAFRDALGQLPVYRHGLIAADPTLRTFFTSMFLHVDLFHLIGNILFFFVTGPFLEDVYGRIAFPVLYFSGGLAAGVAQIASDPGAVVPMVGASGAIAAIMGAYLIRFHRTRLRFVFIPFILRPTFNFRFFLPAWVVLPLWFLTQVVLGLGADAEATVAFSAHVGGFVFGLAFGSVFALLGIEKKFIAPRVEGSISWKQNEEVIAAASAQQAGDPGSAMSLVARALEKDPDNLEANRIGYESAVALRDPFNAERYALKLLDLYGKMGEAELVRGILLESLSDIGDQASERYLFRAARLLEKEGESRKAVGLYQALARNAGTEEGRVQALVRAAIALRGVGDLTEARRMLEQARALPGCTAVWAETIAAQLAACGR